MRRALLAGVAVLTAACSSGASTAAVTAPAPVRTPTASPSSLTPPASPAPRAPATAGSRAPEPVTSRPASVTAQAAAPSCPAYAAPDPQRPVLRADLKVVGRTVSGVQSYRFTPDRPVSELVLRLWGQAPRVAARGGRVSIGHVTVDGRPVTPTRPSATLLRVPHRGAAGVPVTIGFELHVVLPQGADDRLGVRGSTRWFGSALPLLAWERGVGWATQPATSAFAEATTSEAMTVERLRVSRARGLRVVFNGTTVSDAGGTLATFRADRVRDVMLAVGDFRMAFASMSGRPFSVAVAPGMRDDPRVVLRELVRSAAVHQRRFGAFPFAQLSTVVVPDLGGGIEFPGGILLGGGQERDATASHEVAHQWFYGFVGNNQARDPWLDEALATYAEALDRGTGAAYARLPVPAAGLNRVGAPMTYWEPRRAAYFRSVYVQGGVALLRARAAAGPAAFDAAMRCYVRRNAHQVATPADLAAALQHLPAALSALRRVGALPR